MNKPILICENISLDFRIGNYKGQHLKDLITLLLKAKEDKTDIG